MSCMRETDKERRCDYWAVSCPFKTLMQWNMVLVNNLVEKIRCFKKCSKTIGEWINGKQYFFHSFL